MPGTFNEMVYQEAVRLVVEHRAHKAASWLIEALDQEGRGQHWLQNRNRSSAPDEFPAVQTGELMASISAVESSYHAFDVGSFSDASEQGYREAIDLESLPPSQGGRPFLEMALASSDLHDMIMEP